MPQKQSRTASELAEILMAEIRKYPECGHIVSVAVTPPMMQGVHGANWNATWQVKGNEPVGPHAGQITRRLQSQYDLE